MRPTSKRQPMLRSGRRIMSPIRNRGTRGAVLTLWEIKVRAIANWWGVSGMLAGVFGVPVGLVVMTAVSLFTTAPSKDVQSFVEDLRKAQPA